jgi:hypothetical protein
MKFDCGLSWEDEVHRRQRWHPWFAWRPARVGPHDCRWLEWVERKGAPRYEPGGPTSWRWEYRAGPTLASPAP